MAGLTTSKKLLPKDIYVRPLLPSLLVFIAFMVIIGISFHTARQDIEVQQDAAVKQDSTFVESTLQQRFNVYENSLRASNGLFLSSDFVARSEWTTYVKSLDLPTRYPGIRALGFAKVLPSSERETFETAVRTDDLSTYAIYPVTNNPYIAPLKYVVPLDTSQFSDTNSPAIGFDMYSDPLRAKAMVRSAETGHASLSGIVDLLPVQNTQSGKGFLLFYPLYKKNMPISTTQERTAAIDGYFYAPFAINSVFNTLFTITDSSFAFTIYDGVPTRSSLIYDSIKPKDQNGFKEVKQSTVSLFGEKWTIIYKIKKEIVPYSVRARPLSVLIGGSIFSAALALIIYLLIQRRTRALAYSEQRKLEEAKDELLSLASHQLRTPATAVKQYVSMVKEGFAGDLTEEQKKLLQMAYESNERQLTIVDDLLYVARVDAGKATLKTETVDIGSLMSSVVEDQCSVMKLRKQKVDYKLPRKPIVAEVDPQYLRMIFENLLSNASKYSHEKKTVKIVMYKQKDWITISVSDSGVGIKEADFENVFIKFSRIPNELTRQTAGSGIGLYLAKQLALLHDGDLTFVSKESIGSTFTLLLPNKSHNQNEQ